jgi:hypothetical protein
MALLSIRFNKPQFQHWQLNDGHDPLAGLAEKERFKNKERYVDQVEMEISIILPGMVSPQR